ncbi:MAG: glycosyl transferase [Janthinobacterium lividum]
MMVLEYSLRKHASMPVEIHWMQLSRDPQSFWYADPQSGAGWRTEQWATPFSGFRWAVPAHCNYRGRAIYMDADMLVLTDIAALWRMPFEPGKVVMGKGRKRAWRFCVSVWDCAAAQRVLPPLEQLKSQPDAHRRLVAAFSEHPETIQALDSDFNNVDGEGKPVRSIKILHYSDMGTQFSHRYAVPRVAAEGRRHWFDGEIVEHPRADLQALFEQYYAEAQAYGYRLDDYRAAQRFGTFAKASQADYAGNHRTRRQRGWRHAYRSGLARVRALFQPAFADRKN